MTGRTCLGCRKVLEKSTMVRFVVSEGHISPDTDGRLGGRGAYVCSRECFKEACRNKGAFSRAFRSKVEPPDPDAVWERAVSARHK